MARFKELPKDVTLDGEVSNQYTCWISPYEADLFHKLFGGRSNFQDTVSIVKTMNSPHWKNITFQVCGTAQ